MSTVTRKVIGRIQQVEGSYLIVEKVLLCDDKGNPIDGYGYLVVSEDKKAVVSEWVDVPSIYKTPTFMNSTECNHLLSSVELFSDDTMFDIWCDEPDENEIFLCDVKDDTVSE